MTIESMTFPEAPTFFSSATQDFVFVPTLTTFTFNGKHIESLNFLLGGPAAALIEVDVHRRLASRQSEFRELVSRFPSRSHLSPDLQKDVAVMAGPPVNAPGACTAEDTEGRRE